MAENVEKKEAPVAAEKQQAPKAPAPHGGEGKGQHAQAPAGPPGQRRERRPSSIIRLAGRDINGSLILERALDQVKGLGSSMSHALSVVLESKFNIPKTATLSSLTEQQIADVEGVIKDPFKNGIPMFMLNRRKDMETGKDLHVVSNDLSFAVRQDVNRIVGLKTWKGFRHQYGQRVRGQRTRSTGRTGSTIGVTKKSAVPVPAGKAAAAPAGAPGAPKEGAPKAAPAAKPAAPEKK